MNYGRKPHDLSAVGLEMSINYCAGLVSGLGAEPFYLVKTAFHPVSCNVCLYLCYCSKCTMTEAVPIEHFFETASLSGLRANADGTFLAYISNANTSRGQIYVHRTEASDNTEDRLLTDVDGTISGLAFSPTDPSLLAVVADYHGNERGQLALYDVCAGKRRQLTDDNEKHHLGDWSPDGTSIALTTNHSNATTCDIEVLDIASGERRVLGTQEGEVFPIAFTPNGSHVLVQEVIAWNSITRWWAYPTDPKSTGPPVRVTPDTYDTFFKAPTWFPDGNMLLISEWASQEPGNPGMRELYHGRVSHPLGQLALTRLIGSTSDIDDVTLSPDGSQALVLTNEAGNTKVTAYNVDHAPGEVPDLTPAENQPPSLPIGTTRWLDWTKHNGVLVQHSTYAGPQLYQWDIQSNPTPFMHTESPVPPTALTEPRTMSYESFDGTRVDGLVYEAPQDPENIVARPAVFWIHGGPESNVEAGDWIPRVQILVNNGFTVIAPNMRGSTGRGKQFRMAANGTRRWDSLRDIDALYDHVASHMSDRIDSARIALAGGSSAGIIVLGCIAHETDPNHPRYAAAVANSAIADLESFFERTSPERRAQRAQTYGDYTDPEILAFMRDISALRHAGRINVPVRFVHGEQDPRVPIDQPRQMLAALRRSGIVDAEVDSYPDEGHVLLKRENKIRAIAGTIAFLRRTLQ